MWRTRPGARCWLQTSPPPLLYRGEHGALWRPAMLQPFVERLTVHADPTCPFRHDQRLATNRETVIISPVGCLFCWSRPPDIARLVIAVRVWISIEAVLR